MRLKYVSVTWMLLALCCLAAPAHAAEDPTWWTAAAKEAEEGGYRLIDTKGLAELIASGREMLVIDVRADYEFETGHIPGSSNLEFDLGDRLTMDSAKQAEFEALAGPDRKRMLVIYCRSFR